MLPSRISPIFFYVLIGTLACVAGVSQSALKPSVTAQARAQVARGQLDAAEKNLWNVLSLNPNQPEALTLLGVIRGRQKRYAEAEALFRHVLEIDPKSVVARRNLASAFIAEDKQDAAVEQYQKLVELSPRDYTARIELAQLYVAKGEFKDGVSTLDGIPQGHLPTEAIPVKAAGFLGVGRREQAAELVSIARGSAATEMDLAEVFLDANAPDLAAKAVDEAFSRSQHPSARLYALRGRAQEAQGHVEAASKSLNEALARDPNSVEIMLALAALDASQDKHRESFAMLKRAYDLQPDSPGVLRALVVESVKAGQPETAVRVAHTLVQASPENLDDLYVAGAAMLEGEDYPSATSVFEKYVSQRPADGKGFLGLGMAELGQHHYPEARQALERAIQIDPRNPDAEYQLGAIADQQGSSAEAIEHFERAVELQPNHAKALTSLGAQYLQSGKLEKAEEVLRRAVAAQPNDAKAQYELALTLAKVGKTEEARQHMEQSRTLEAAEQLRKSRASKANTP